MVAAVSTPSSSRQRRLFAEIVADHGAALARLCGGYERGAAEREELLQDIFLALWRSLASYRGDASLRTWMYRVAHNVATSHIQRAKRRPTTTTVGEREHHATDNPPDARLERGQQLDLLCDAIQSLRPIDRQIILLTLEDLPQAEIATITGISESSVSTRVGRIKAELSRAVRSQR